MWIAAIFIVIAVGLLIVGVAIGKNSLITSRGDASILGKNLDETQATLEQVEAELIDARLSSQVHKDAIDVLRIEIQQAHTQLAQLGEEVTFYKSLMAPNEIRQGLQVDEIDIRAVDARTYQFELLLTQIALRRSFISGKVALAVAGLEGDEQVVKSLTELGDGAAYPMNFKFRYFQDMRGTFTLPENFVPQQIIVTAQRSGKTSKGKPWEPLQGRFDWPRG